MRLWHIDLIDVLPRQQLLGQWRELCCIASNIKKNNTPNHLLVNKILDFSWLHFKSYCVNVIDEMKKRGYKVCEEKGIKIISLTGASGGLMKDFGGILLNVPSTDTPRIQESHIMIGHIICELVEKTTVYSLRTTD